MYIYENKRFPISKNSMGFMATLGEIHCHYQKYDNIFDPSYINGKR